MDGGRERPTKLAPSSKGDLRVRRNAGRRNRTYLRRGRLLQRARLRITLDTFIYSKELKPFVPVATYEAGEGVVSNEEIVSMIEGAVMPYFGFAYRLDKAQFGFHAMTGSGQAKVDHSKFSVEHAQHVANFLVDEARLSANMFYETNKEQERLLSNHDVKTVTLPTPMYSEYDNSEESELFDFYRTEMYIF